MPTRSTPNCLATSLACFVGLIRDARPDFNAFAASAAGMPPSRIATRSVARSFTSPPRDLITGPTFGIAIDKSSSVAEVWFSTALRKLMDSASSLVFSLNAD